MASERGGTQVASEQAMELIGLLEAHAIDAGSFLFRQDEHYARMKLAEADLVAYITLLESMRGENLKLLNERDTLKEQACDFMRNSREFAAVIERWMNRARVLEAAVRELVVQVSTRAEDVYFVGGKTYLRSRFRKDFPATAAALALLAEKGGSDVR